MSLKLDGKRKNKKSAYLRVDNRQNTVLRDSKELIYSSSGLISRGYGNQTAWIRYIRWRSVSSRWSSYQ